MKLGQWVSLKFMGADPRCRVATPESNALPGSYETHPVCLREGPAPSGPALILTAQLSN
jgi:hypothetical protein